MKDLIKNKKFISVYLAWILIHTFLLFQANHSYGSKSDFWPFISTELGAYDISEWFLYVFTPLVILFLIIAFNDKTTKIILFLLALNLSTKAQIGGDFIPLAPNQSTIPGSSIQQDSKSSLQQELDELSRELPIPEAPDPRYSTKEDFENWQNKLSYQSHELMRRSDIIFAKYRGIDSLNKIAQQTKEIVNDHENSPEQLPEKNQNIETINPENKKSLSTQMQPTTFNWDKCNADRFVNSPCIKVLGFQPYDPETQPKEYQMQEQRYEECEHEKTMETIKKGAIIVCVVLGLIGLIFFGIKKIKPTHQLPNM